MGKTIVKVLKGMCVLAIFMASVVLPVKEVKAASVSIWASADTVYVGDTVTFTVSVNGGAGRVDLSGAVNSSDFIDNSTLYYSATASSPGYLTVQLSAEIADYNSEKDVYVNRTCSVQVINRPVNPKPQPRPEQNPNPSPNLEPDFEDDVDVNDVEDEEEVLSGVNTLSSLSISQGSLSPKFSKKKTSYKVELPKDAKELKISAKASDKKAKVTGTGTKKLKPGDNTFTITCVAQNGKKKTYTIHAHVDETPLVYVDYNGEKLGVSRISTTLPKKLFTSTTITIDDHKVPAWENDALHMTLVYLENGKQKDFYFYDTKEMKVTSIYRPMALIGENVAMIDVPKKLQKRDGMTFTEIQIDGQKLPGWTFDDPAFKDYALIYVMNDAGDCVYYQYEKTKESLQLYDGGAAVTQDAYNKEKQSFEKEISQLQILLGGLGCFSVLMLILYVFKGKRKNKKEI